jgi:hypothetical protein
MVHKKEIVLTHSVDLDTGRSVSTVNNNDTDIKEISKNIHDVVAHTLSTFTSKWIGCFNEAISEGDYTRAFDTFNKNKDSLSFCRDENIIPSLRLMDVSSLSGEDRKTFLSHLLAFSSGLRNIESLKYCIKNLLHEYHDQLEPAFIANIQVEQANIAAKEKLYNKANIIYQKIISEGVDSGAMAWSYKGLSLISETHKDVISYSEKAADKFLETGNISQAANSFMYIAKIVSEDNIQQSIALIDKSIILYESTTSTNRVLLASLKKSKSSYLVRIGYMEEALSLAEEICILLRGLMGAETDLHSSLCLVEMISIKIGDKKNAEIFRDEAHNLSKTIKDPDFLFSQRIGALISNSNIIDSSILSEVINSGNKNLMSAVLLYQSTNKSLNLVETLELLDSTLNIFGTQTDNPFEDIIYFAIAEVYRKNKMIDMACKYYDKSLSFNAYYQPTIQNYIAMLFEQSLWEKAAKIIKAKIDLVGEDPNLCFIYAKSLYGYGEYILAFKYARL